MESESWDTDPLTDQERIVARHKATGTPITGGDELTAVDYGMNDPVTGDPVVGRQCPDPAGIAGTGWRNPAAAERLQRHRRPGSRRRQACRGAVLHRFPARSARPFHAPADAFGQVRPPQRVHRAQWLRPVGMPARSETPPATVRHGPVRLTPERFECRRVTMVQPRTCAIPQRGEFFPNGVILPHSIGPKGCITGYSVVETR